MVQEHAAQHASTMLSIIMLSISFVSLLGAVIWLSLIGNKYLKHAEELPNHDEKG